jgi:hypothetical protein
MLALEHINVSLTTGLEAFKKGINKTRKGSFLWNKTLSPQAKLSNMMDAIRSLGHGSLLGVQEGCSAGISPKEDEVMHRMTQAQTLGFWALFSKTVVLERQFMLASGIGQKLKNFEGAYSGGQFFVLHTRLGF